MIFDNSKVKAAVGDFDCPSWAVGRNADGGGAVSSRAEEFDAALDHVYDRIVAAARRERHFAADRGDRRPVRVSLGGLAPRLAYAISVMRR